jgi:hypothetical protein
LDDEWYWTVGNILGGLVAIISFIASWVYCASEYGYLLGFGLGWLPSIILAVILFFATKFLWGPVLGLIGLAVLLEIRN